MATRSSKEHSREIRDFIVENVSAHPSDTTKKVSEKFGISRQAAHRHVNKLVAAGMLTSSGETRKKRYELKPVAETSFTVAITPELKEDVVWREKIRPLIDNIPQNVLEICQYGFTEILNNAIDHSQGTEAVISLERTMPYIQTSILDNGIGIFNKLKSELHLEDERHVMLELSKGKLTTDSSRHTGEGIFFTTRIFDFFFIFSGKYSFTHTYKRPDDAWLFEEQDETKGTSVAMRIHLKSPRRLQDIFDQFASSKGNYGFTRTHVPVSLAKYGDENLISRSQAKRLLARFEKFKEVILDFKNVNTLGQAFADEIFRVFTTQNPQVQIIPFNTSEQVKKMIARVKSGGEQPAEKKL